MKSPARGAFQASRVRSGSTASITSVTGSTDTARNGRNRSGSTGANTWTMRFVHIYAWLAPLVLRGDAF